MAHASKIREAFQKGAGILRLAPNFVPRRFSQAGRRLRLHPDDYYALGTQRGSIKERWFSSVIPAMNGPLAPADEGRSYVAPTEKKEDRFLFKDAIEELGIDIIGSELKKKFGTWPMYSKFFDYELPLFHHLHLDDVAAARVGRIGKPEAYYFPPQLNNHLGTFPVTYFGFDPDVKKDQDRERLLDYEKGDNRITELSRAYRIELGTGWYTPARSCPCSRVGVDVRASVELRCKLSAGKHHSGRVLPLRVPGGKRARGKKTGHRLRHRPYGLGEKCRPALQKALLSAAPGVPGNG